MLTESFVASIATPRKPTAQTQHKDFGIFFHEYQPQPTLRQAFKKSCTGPNGLAVSSTHVFAAQTDKATVNIYSIERNNQEALFPFKEKISSLAIVGRPEDAAILALGTESGQVILCELLTGRQVSTPAAHLQAIECMTVDPTNNFLLTGSPDKNILVWSVPTLLSFSSSSPSYDPNAPSPYSPIHTLSNHRGPITCLATGHSHSSANIAISGSSDKSCIIWNYQEGQLLHTFLLAATPLCIALDPADRAFYAGHEDGSVQLVDFYERRSIEHVVYDQKLTDTPTQPPESKRWPATSEPSAVLSLDVCYDGTAVLTGHQSGKIRQWDVATGLSQGKDVADLNAPVTNLLMQRPEGFLKSRKAVSKALIVKKPLFQTSMNSKSVSGVPDDYVFEAQFASTLPLPRFHGRRTREQQQPDKDDLMDDFDEALTHPSLPPDLMEECQQAISAPAEDAVGDIAALKGWQTDPRRDVIEAQEQVTEARKENLKLMQMMDELGQEVLRMKDTETARKRKKKMKQARKELYQEAQRKKARGEAIDSDAEMKEPEDDSSSSDDMSAT